MGNEVLKVFVGDGVNTGTSKATLSAGDLLIKLASNESSNPSSAGEDIVIFGKTNKGLRRSTKIKKANIIYANFAVGAATTQKVTRFALGGETLAASTDYALGIEIKENQRTVYNSNAKFIANYKTGSVASGITEYAMIASAFAKQFANQPSLAYGSINRLVKVERYDTGSTPSMSTLGSGANATVTAGSRTVTTAAAHSAVAGSVISLAGVIYIVDSVESTTQFTIDVPYEGATATVNAGTTVATNAGIVTFTGTGGATSGNITFRFTGVAQARENKYSQNVEVDYNVIYPRGFVTAVPVVSTAFVPGVGTYAQLRDLEERAYTNSTPHINYKNFPFEDWEFNVDLSSRSTLYNLLTITYILDDGNRNFMQGSARGTEHTIVVAAPAVADGQMDSGTAGTFATLFNTWYGSTLITSDPS